MTKTLPVLFLALLPAMAEPSGLAYMTVTPCRLVDTRPGPPGLSSGVVRPFGAMGKCGIAANAVVLEANVTVTGADGNGFVSILEPIGTPPPPPVTATTSLINYSAGQTRANAARIRLSAAGSFWLLASGAKTHVIVDVSGYYVVLP